MIKSNYVKETFQWWKATAILIALMVLTVVGANAQVPYGWTPTTGGTYTQLSGGGITVINTNAGLSVSMSNNQDDGAALVTLPFTFTYMGNPFTQVTFCTNGWIGMGDQLSVSAGNGRTASNMFTSTVPNNTIGVWFKDMGANFPSIGVGSMRHGLTGTGIYTFQWDQAVGSGFNVTTANLIRFQVSIHGPASATPGRIEFLYGSTNGTTAFGAAIGIENATSGTNNYINAINGLQNSTSTSTVWPGNGNGWRFDPLPPCSTPSDQPTALTLTPVSTSQINGSFTAASGSPSGYLVVRYPNGASTTNPVDLTTYTVGASLGLGTVVSVGAATTFNNTGLTGGTAYDYYVYSYNSGTCFPGPMYNTSINAGQNSGTASTNACGTIVSPITVGPTGTYPTLSGAGGAIAAIAATGISAPLVIEMESAYTGAGETYPITMSYDACITATNTLTIRPEATAASAITITSNNATATIDMNGAKFVTIDGRPGGVGINKYLLIENSSTTGQAVLLRNEASNNTLTYLDARASNANGSNNTSTAVAGSTIPGVIAIGTTTGLNGNDNNTISFCDIHSITSGGNLGVGFYSYNATTAGSAANNDNNTIDNNNVFDFFLAATASAGINVSFGCNNYTVTNNRIYQTGTRTYTGTQTVKGMWMSPGSGVNGSGFVTTGNYIGGANSAGTGIMTMTGTTSWLFIAFDHLPGTGTASSVQGNTITNISMTSASTSTTAFVGILIAGGNVDIGTTTANTIGSTTTNGAISYNTTGSLGGFMGIRKTGAASANISNNIISGINCSSSATTVCGFAGISVTAGTNTVSNNTVGSNTLANSINMPLVTTSSVSAQAMRGIFVSGGTNTVSGNTISNLNMSTEKNGTQGNTVTGISLTAGSSSITGNTIKNLTSATQTTGGGANSAILGINCTSTTAPVTISGNTIHSLKLTNATSVTASGIQAINFTAPTSGTNVIEKNFIHSFSIANNSSTAAYISGMDLGNGTATVKNNMIRLGIDENGNSVTAGIMARGISPNSGTFNIYNNSIYIGGTGVLTSTINSFCLQKTGAATLDVKNNIFQNNRSNASGTAKHYSVYLANATNLNINYNDYFGTGTGYVFAFNGTADVATYTPGWFSGDVTSQTGDPQFIDPTGSAATVDLHIHPTSITIIEQNGTNIASVTDDFDSQLRSGLTPDDIGADAGNFLGFFCVGPPASATATLTVPGQVCGNVTKTINLSGFTATPGYTYQWQESTTGLPGSFVNVTGGTGANAISYTTAIINTSMYYQCEIGCAFGVGTTTSNSVFADILPAPVLTVTPTTGTSVCSGANVDLSATGALSYLWTVNPGTSGYPIVSLLTTRNNLATVSSRPTATLASGTGAPPATVASPTWIYTVTGTGANGCTSASSVTLNVITTPVVPNVLTYSYAPSTNCAPGTPITFTLNNNGTIGAGQWVYNWYDQTGTTLLQSTTNTLSSDTYTPATPAANGNYVFTAKVSNTLCPSSYAVASPNYFIGYTSLKVATDANCGDNGTLKVYPEGQNNFSTWYFNNFNVGAQGAGFDAVYGNTTITAGQCRITPQANSQTGAFLVRNPGAINSNNLQVDFKLSTAPRGFAFNILGADGLCWSYGGDVTQGTVTTGGLGEGGSGTGIKLAFDATANTASNTPGIYLMYNSLVAGQGPTDAGVLAFKYGSSWQGLIDAPVSITITQNGLVTVSVNNEVIFDHIQLPAAYLTANKSNWIHSFTSRTGGSNELHAIDDLNIRYNPSYEYSINSTTGTDGTWSTNNSYTGLAAGSYPVWVRNPSNPSCFANTGNAVIGTSPSPSSANTVAAPGYNTTICAGSSTDLVTSVSVPGAVFLWEEATSIGGPYSPAAGTNNTETYSTGSLTSSKYYRCTFTCPSASAVTSTPVLVTVNIGSISSTNSPQQINCIGDNVTLTATPGANTTPVWYDVATGGSPLFTGNSYTVAPTSLPKTYYVEPVTTLYTNHFDNGGETSFGNILGSVTAGSGIASRFNTSASIRIDSIKVYPSVAGSLTISLQNALSTTTIQSYSTTITAGQVGNFINLPVNLIVPGSGNYQLTTGGTASCNYYSSYTGSYASSYMSLGGVFSIVGGSTSATGATSTAMYGSALNWSITTSCPAGFGNRTAVVVNANPSFLVSVTPANTTGLCATAIQALTASSPNAYSSYTWSPVTNLYSDAAATIPLTVTDNQATVYFKAPTAGSNSYTVSTAGSGCTNTGTASVSTIAAPNVTVTATPNAVCSGDNVQLNAVVNSASPYCQAAYTTGTGANDYITNVTLGTINNTTGASASPYNTYYSALNTNLTANIAYTVTGTINNGGTEGVAVWIDYNQNGIFEASEKLGEQSTLSFSIGFTVPAGALNGATRMRVRNVFNTTSIDPCNSYTYGEVEDYNVTISGGVTPGGYTFDWSTNSTYLSATNIANPVAQAVTSPQTYSVTVTPTSGCAATQTVPVTVNPIPTPVVQGGNPTETVCKAYH